MLEAKGNIWDMSFDVICVTTNGVVKSDGRAVMGAGIAKDARDRYPGIDRDLGYLIRSYGNVCHVLPNPGSVQPKIVSFPTKHHWRDKADLNLIKASALQLINILEGLDHVMSVRSIGIPRPGCGYGGLDWETDVKPVLAPILSDRYTVVTF